MKNNFLLALLTLFTADSIQAQVPSYVPTNGLVAYWPFNGNANDESGNGNNGTVNGATLTTDRFGNSNNAYSFDGINDYIATNFVPNNSNQSRTISVWFNENGLTLPNDGYSIVSYGASSDNCSQAGGRFELGMYFNPNINAKSIKVDGVCTAISASTTYSNGWHHFIVTYDNSFGNLFRFIKLYIDGILITGINYNPNTIINTLNLSNFTIGKSPSSSSTTQRSYNGLLDDIGIWNRALTPEEITNLYNSVNTTDCSTLVINSGQLNTNPITYTSTVNIYPNPANDHITIDCGNLANVVGWNIKITNMLGQEVFSAPMNTQQYTVALNSWSGQGMYFVKILNAQNEVVNIKKIILQ
ncbi:MAG: T9SS type A sorting domain-containing protein [Flavobacterium sp.]|nr:T9SS type A sorting domain-containing protein [Flavobacterium sp.]